MTLWSVVIEHCVQCLEGTLNLYSTVSELGNKHRLCSVSEWLYSVHGCNI